MKTIYTILTVIVLILIAIALKRRHNRRNRKPTFRITDAARNCAKEYKRGHNDGQVDTAYYNGFINGYDLKNN